MKRTFSFVAATRFWRQDPRYLTTIIYDVHACGGVLTQLRSDVYEGWGCYLDDYRACPGFMTGRPLNRQDIP